MKHIRIFKSLTVALWVYKQKEFQCVSTHLSIKPNVHLCVKIESWQRLFDVPKYR